MESLRIAAVQLDYAPALSTATGNYWLPEEPAAPNDPLTGPTPELSVRRLREWGATSPLQTTLKLRNERTISDHLNLRLKQVLDYCAAASCDIVIFPEASVPPASLAILSGYSTTFAIFAGIGRIRSSDLADVRLNGIAAEHVHQNCAIFLDQERRHVVTKMRLADGERAVSGSGTQTFQFHRRGRAYGIAATICRDYLADDDRIQDAPYPIDIALISALSRNTNEFIGRTPRHLRAFANHAYYGGTCIQVPHLESLGLSDDFGSEPLPARHEGVVIIDYVDLPRKVTPPQAAFNRLVARSAIVYDDRVPADTDRASLAQLVLNMRDLRADALEDPLVTDFLESASRFLGTGGNAVLFRAVELLRDNQLTGTVTQEELHTLTRHLLLTDVQSPAEVKYAQIEGLLEVISVALGRAPDAGAGLGRFRDDLLGVKLALLDRVRSRYKATSDRIAGQPGLTSDGSDESEAFYGATLGAYDAKKAVQSLPLQLDVLRTLAAENDPSMKLAYRLITTKTLSTELVPFLVASGEVRNADPRRVEALREGLGQLLGVAYSAAWETSSSLPTAEGLAWEMEILPRATAWIPPITEDWAPIIDLLRAQENEIELAITCQVAKDLSALTRDAAREKIEFPPGRFLDERNKEAAEYLASIADDAASGTEPANLTVRILLRAPVEPPDTLVRSVGLRLIGSLDFDLVNPRTAIRSFGLRPSEALRIFHPPFGATQSRGIAESRRTNISLPAIHLSGGGVSIGSATLASARYDRNTRVRLAAESRLRHMYVIGRTGSGKTNFLKTLARQDITSGSGVAVIDPHGDLVDHLLRHVGEREDDVLLLDFGDAAALPVLNPIDLDVSSDVTNARRLAIDDLIALIVRQSFHQFYGPRFEDIVRLTLESLAVSNLTDTPTVLDVSRVLRSKSRRTRLVESLDDPDLIDRWRNFDMQREQELAELIHWTLAKFSDMDRDGTLGAVLGGGKSSVSISRVVRDSGILLVRIPEWEIGPAASVFIGGLIQERIRRAAFERFSRSTRQPPPFYLYVDEFQKFSTSGFEQLVAEARKFGLGLIMSHQNLRQLEDFSRFTGSSSRQLLESILGNVANMVALGVSASDADSLANEFGVSATALRNISANTALVRADLSRGETRTFSVRIPYAESDPGVLSSPQAVRERMVRMGYWRPRETVAEFMSQNRNVMEGPELPTSATPSSPAAQGQALAVSSLPTQFEESKAERFLREWRAARVESRDEELPTQPFIVRHKGKVASVDSDFLSNVGLGAFPQAARPRFLQHIRTTLELMVGEELTKGMAPQELDAFDEIREDKEAAHKWLNDKRPHHRDVILEQYEVLADILRSVALEVLHEEGIESDPELEDDAGKAERVNAKEDSRQIRLWARENGFEVATHGPIAAGVRDAYNARKAG